MSDWNTLVNELGLKLRPIERWPQDWTRDRERSPFSAPWKDTLAMLTRELWNLSAHGIVLQIALRERDFRLDGMPRADARPNHPGVILSFTSQHGPLALPCDTFPDWKHNLRAIAFHLEHLRKASLYGVGRFGEQYRGWKALGDGTPAAESFAVNPEEAADTLAAAAYGNIRGGSFVKPILADFDTFTQVYREAVKRAHPDAGGDEATFRQVQAAAELLKKHHGR